MQFCVNVLPQGTLTCLLLQVHGSREQERIDCMSDKTRYHYPWPSRLFMKFLVCASYNADIIMYSYRPHSRADHHFHTAFNMFVDELCLQLVRDYHTEVHHREARAQQQTSFVCRVWDNTTPNIPWLQPATSSAWFVAPSTTSI